MDILRKVYDSGVDLFLIEHNMDVVMNLSHRITVLNFGCKIAEGTPEEIQHDPQVVKAYLATASARRNEYGTDFKPEKRLLLL